MNSRIVRRSTTGVFALVLTVCLMTAPVVAQQSEDDLRAYYSDLYLALVSYDLRDVPFDSKTVTVRRNESLMKIAERLRFPKLDVLHLAAAIYENNSRAFEGGDASRLSVGATLILPSVEDIFVAQDRYESIKLSGANNFAVDENHTDSDSRLASRRSPSLAEPALTEELPGNQVVTLTSYRSDGVSALNSRRRGGFLSSESEFAPDDVSGPRVTTLEQLNVEEGYSKWLDALDEEALTDQPAESVQPVEAAGSNPVEADAEIAEDALADEALLSDADFLDSEALEALVEDAVSPEAVATQTVKQNSNDAQEVMEVAAAMPVLPVTEPGQLEENSAVNVDAVVPPVVVNDTRIAKAVEGTFYLGQPKDADGSSLHAVSADPLSNMVEWSFEEGVSVGAVLGQLADYVGYELVGVDGIVLNTYNRPLPAIQRQVSGLSAEKAFDVLAGRGLHTVFDHVTRTVKHIPKQFYDAERETSEEPVIEPEPALVEAPESQGTETDTDMAASEEQGVAAQVVAEAEQTANTEQVAETAIVAELKEDVEQPQSKQITSISRRLESIVISNHQTHEKIVKASGIATMLK